MTAKTFAKQTDMASARRPAKFFGREDQDGCEINRFNFQTGKLKKKSVDKIV